MHAVGIDGSLGPVALVDSRCYRPRGSNGLDAGVPLAFLWKCLANASMSTRIPSVRAQDSLVRLLLQAGCTRRDLVDVLRGNGLEELSLSLPRGDSDRDDLNRGIQFLARRGALTGDLLDAVEAARGDLRDGLADLRVELELVPPSQPLLDELALAALKRVARQAGLHRGVNHARLKHRLPLALRAASATGSDEPAHVHFDRLLRKRNALGELRNDHVIVVLQYAESGLPGTDESKQSTLVRFSTTPGQRRPRLSAPSHLPDGPLRLRLAQGALRGLSASTHRRLRLRPDRILVSIPGDGAHAPARAGENLEHELEVRHDPISCCPQFLGLATDRTSQAARARHSLELTRGAGENGRDHLELQLEETLERVL
jgi:hypothetical protein